MVKIFKEVERISDEILSLRRDIHRHPELGNDVRRTADLVEETLNKCGIETVRTEANAVAGTLIGGLPGKTVALRADMDALPVTEATGAEFASEIPGCMHACGHDVHTAALLGTAMVLAGHKEELKGKVVFLFEPDEEGSGGAEQMIKDGLPGGADAVFGAHVDPALPEGSVGIRYGKFYAAADMFNVDVKGKSSHGAEREKGVDALYSAARMISELIDLPGKVIDDRCVLTVGEIHSGTARNILPGSAHFEGIIRTLGDDARSAMKEAFFCTVSRIAGETGTEADIEFIRGYPGIVNDKAMTGLAHDVAASIFARDRIKEIEEPTMTTEDFGYFLDKAPGSFYHIGAGCSEPLHSSRFLPAEGAVLTAAEMHIAVVLIFLNGEI